MTKLSLTPTAETALLGEKSMLEWPKAAMLCGPIEWVSCDSF